MPFIIPLFVAVILGFIALFICLAHSVGDIEAPKSARFGLIGTTVLIVGWLIAFACVPDEVEETKVVPVQMMQTEDGTIATISYLDRYGNTTLVNLNKVFQRQVDPKYNVKVTIYKLGPYLGLSNLQASDHYDLVKAEE